MGEKLDIEGAFRKVGPQLPKAADAGNSIRAKSLGHRAHHSTRNDLVGERLLILFSLVSAAIAFAAVFRLMAGSPMAPYGSVAAATIVGTLTAPLRYQRLAAQALPFADAPQEKSPELTGELVEKRRDIQRVTLRNRALMRASLFGYVLCLWLLSATASPKLHNAHTLMLIVVLAIPLLMLGIIIRVLDS
ncbi:MAG TPA: hypothetical protein VFA87_11490 [Rhizomicrobium sp.]|nr:hypothetical protein [Rhizomicrobium sp.]